MRRNPFFHSPAPDEPASVTNGLLDAILGVVLFFAIFVAGFWLLVLGA